MGEEKMFKLKSEKGSVVVYVLVTMIVFTIICVAIFIRSSNKQQMQIETLDKLQELYSSNETAEDVYKKYIGGDVIPIYTQEQFLAIGSDSVLNINNTVYKLSKGLTYYLQSNINISSGNDATNIINMIKNKEINFEGQGYKIYMSNGDVYTEDTNYTEPE